jgi:hypothetical protein
MVGRLLLGLNDGRTLGGRLGSLGFIVGSSVVGAEVSVGVLEGDGVLK